ncbi:MAG: CAP domain-containing protein [Candidatus Paceibacterota bacterium]
MNGKRFYFGKIIAAQVIALITSSILVQHVFLGDAPIVRAEFKLELAQVPEKLVSVVREAPQTIASFYNDVIRRKVLANFPPPWVDESAPIHPGQNIPFPQGSPAPTSTNTGSQATPAPINASPTNVQKRLPRLFPTSVPTLIAKIPTIVLFPTGRPKPTKKPVPTVPPPQPPPADVASLEKQTVTLINQKRSSEGLAPVSINSQLTNAARRHSADISSKRICGHTGSDGTDPWDRVRAAGYTGRLYGETVSCGARTAEQAVNGWWSSPPHRAILTNSGIREIGLGWVRNYQTAVVGY